MNHPNEDRAKLIVERVGTDLRILMPGRAKMNDEDWAQIDSSVSSAYRLGFDDGHVEAERKARRPA